MAEKDQQEPQLAWFWTALTAPLERQSTEPPLTSSRISSLRSTPKPVYPRRRFFSEVVQVDRKL